MEITYLPSNSLKSRKPSPPHRRTPVLPPVPRKFDFGLTARHPLVPLPAVMMFLDRNAREILALIEAGELRWAFDIRSLAARTKEVRVLRQSIFEYAGLIATDPVPAGPRGEDLEFSQTMKRIVPEGTILKVSVTSAPASGLHLKLRLSPAACQKMLFPQEPLLSGSEIAQCFSCNNQHVLNLIREKSLQAANLRRGPKASPLVLRNSVIQFLQARRMS